MDIDATLVHALTICCFQAVLVIVGSAAQTVGHVSMKAKTRVSM